MSSKTTTPASPQDQDWADLLSPRRRNLMTRGGLAAALAASGLSASALAQVPAPNHKTPPAGKSPWAKR